MPTSEERLTTLEQTVAFLQKRFNEVDIQSINHNATMLLGLVYTQQSDIREMKVHLTTIDQHLSTMDQRLDRLETRSNEHTSLLNGHTARFDRVETLLTQILARLPENPQQK